LEKLLKVLYGGNRFFRKVGKEELIMSKSTLRRDLIVRRWVVVAEERSKRPSDFLKKNDKELKICPFCPGNEQETPPEITAYRRKDSGLWYIRVVPNKFGAFSISENPLERKKIGIFREMEARGAHEVIISTPQHEKRIYDFSPDEMYELLWVCKERTLDLKNDPLIESVFIFGNEGEDAGASLEHEHWQLVGLPVIPKLIWDEIEACRECWDRDDNCAFCLLTQQEYGEKVRIVAENEHFFSLSKYDGRVPFETWILPLAHRPLFEDGGEKILRPLAEILCETIQRIGAVLNRPDFNIFFHSAPLRDRTHDRYYHFHLEILPILTRVAGFEWGTGFYINPTRSEDAAAFLRDIKIETK